MIPVKKTTSEDKLKSATLSDCGKYRYELMRGKAPYMTIIMLNPSTADSEKDDATIRKLLTLAAGNDYSGIRVYNAYAYRATDPVEIWALLQDQLAHVAVGPHNKHYLQRAFRQKDVVLAWGNHVGREWAFKIVRAARHPKYGCRLHCFGQNKNGSPKHPLYLKNDTKLQPYVHR